MSACLRSTTESRMRYWARDVVDATRTQHFNPVAEKRSYTLNYMRKQIVSSWIRAMSYRMSRLLLGKKNGGDLSRSTGATREVDGEAVAAEQHESARSARGVLLHGCCLVFSSDFFKVYDGFWEGTFLYAEEEILLLSGGKERTADAVFAGGHLHS